MKGVNKYSAGFVPAALEEGGVGTPRYLRDATEAKSPLTSGSHRPMKSPNQGQIFQTPDGSSASRRTRAGRSQPNVASGMASKIKDATKGSASRTTTPK